MDREVMIAEVMRRVGTRIAPGDPICAVVEMNRLALEESVAALLHQTAPVADRITEAGIELARHLGKATTRQILNSLQDARKGIQEEAQTARRDITKEAKALHRATEIAIEEASRLQKHSEAARWIFLVTTLLCGLAITSFAAGYFSATRNNGEHSCQTTSLRP